jgi:hypothetical protein
MNDPELSEEYERELARVTERVRTMPLTRLAQCADMVFTTCAALADLARAAGSGLADGDALPRLGDHALPDQLQVLGVELLATGDENAITAGLALLTDMRKALP